jgi:hypothetical protein
VTPLLRAAADYPARDAIVALPCPGRNRPQRPSAPEFLESDPLLGVGAPNHEIIMSDGRLLRFLLPLLAALTYPPASGAFTPLEAQAATGKVVGRILDGERGTPVGGAVVEVVGLTERITTTSAVDGRYTLADIPAGEVGLRVRMIGYGPKLVTGVRVPAGGSATQDVTLAAEVVQLDEVNVTVEMERGSVSRALGEQRNAANIVNAISAEEIARSPDGDASQAVQRVSGVTVQEGKYVLVRGLGERYTTTALNGARIPSLEPERKVVPLDLFPSGLLDGITTSKTFTPDQAGDMTGAEVNIRTREFPSQRVTTLSISTGLNTASSASSYVRAPNEGSEWLGFAGSERRLPSALRAAGDLRNITPDQQNSLIASLRNTWSARKGSGSPNGSFGISVGGEDPIGGQRIGYLGSLTYSTSQEARRDETKGLAVIGSSPGSAIPFNVYNGSTGRFGVLWGGLLNLSTHLGAGTRISSNNTYTRGADNEANVLTGNNEEFGQDFQFTRLTFVERSVRSNQLAAEHMIGRRHLINWSISNSAVTRNEPDRSDVGYVVTPDGTPERWFGQSRFATRTFGELKEDGWDLGGSYQLALGPVARPVILKVGGAYRTVTRTAETRAYDIVNRTLTDAELSQSPEQIFDGTYAMAGRLTLRANAFAGSYDADDNVSAGFAMLDIPLGSRIKLIGGARMEQWDLSVLTRTVQGDTVRATPNKTDLLPSLALNVQLSDNQNLRLSGSQTVSRPEYRELSPVPYFEQVGLLTTFGNTTLRRASILNGDIRWEWFPSAGEVVSVSAFTKRFDDPIEKVIILQAGAPALSFVNATGANNYGIEIELRKNLGMFADRLLPFTFFANSTLMKSDIEPGNEVLTNANRPMVGQSEYVVNAGLGYLGAGGRFNATLLYNVTGRRIVEAGASGLPDTYENARQLVDASVQFSLFGDTSLKLDGKNILDRPVEFVQGDVTRHRYTTGRVFSLGFSWKP